MRHRSVLESIEFSGFDPYNKSHCSKNWVNDLSNCLGIVPSLNLNTYSSHLDIHPNPFDTPVPMSGMVKGLQKEIDEEFDELTKTLETTDE